jgi:DinB superfamily
MRWRPWDSASACGERQTTSPPSARWDHGCVSAARRYLLERLAACPQAFASSLAQWGAAAFERRPAPDEWSPLEILLHVRAADTIISARIWAVLVRPDAVFPGLDERSYGQLLARGRLPATDQVTAFKLRRLELLGLLETLADAEWALLLRTDFGECPLEQYIAGLATHEDEHLSQLRSITPSGRIP